LKFFSILIVIALAILPLHAAAQEFVEVPVSGYTDMESLNLNNNYTRMYNITVPAGYCFTYDFKVYGSEGIVIYLMEKEQPGLFENYSTPDPVMNFSRTTPTDFGYVHEYILGVNSLSGNDTDFRATLIIEKAPTGNYTLYYILILLGLGALVVFSYKYVVWQEKQEKKEKQVQRRKGKGKKRQ